MKKQNTAPQLNCEMKKSESELLHRYKADDAPDAEYPLPDLVYLIG